MIHNISLSCIKCISFIHIDMYFPLVDTDIALWTVLFTYYSWVYSMSVGLDIAVHIACP